MSRFFGIYILIIVIASAAYLALSRDNNSEYSFPILKGRDALVSTFQRVKEENLDGAVSAGIDSLLAAFSDKVSSTIDAVVDDVKVETFKKVKDVVNDKVDSIGENAGIDIQGVMTEPPNPIIYTVEAGSLAYFTIVNKDSKSLEYKVDWKDGKNNTGSLEKGEKIVLSHEWDKAGEYFIKFKITTIGKEREYQVSINIF
ncbi:hypothetical protein GW950_00265 [Candidatus Wolfebacteria bacterium]|nr:hypothetical protein [Candidatus Wolfebacteria bacterium]